MQCFTTCVHGFPHTFVSVSWQIRHNQNCSFTLWVAKLILYVSFNPQITPQISYNTWDKVIDGHISVKYNCMHLQKLHSGRKWNRFQAKEFTVMSLSSLHLAAAHSRTFQVLFSGHIMAERITSGSPWGRVGSFTCPCKLHKHPSGRWMGSGSAGEQLAARTSCGDGSETKGSLTFWACFYYSPASTSYLVCTLVLDHMLLQAALHSVGWVCHLGHAGCKCWNTAQKLTNPL